MADHPRRRTRVPHLPPEVWHRVLGDFVGDFETLDVLRLVSKIFCAGVSRVRGSHLHGRHLVESFRRYLVAKTTEEHSECAPPPEGASGSRARDHAMMQLQKYRGPNAKGVNTLARTLLVAGGIHHKNWRLAERAIAWGLRRVSPALFGYLWLGKQSADAETRRLQDIMKEATRRHAELAARGTGRQELTYFAGHVARALTFHVGRFEPEAHVALTTQYYALAHACRMGPAASLADLYSDAYRAPTEMSILSSGPVADAAAREGKLRLARYHALLGINTDNHVQYTCRCVREQQIRDELDVFFAEHPGARIERDGEVATAGQIAAAFAAANAAGGGGAPPRN